MYKDDFLLTIDEFGRGTIKDELILNNITGATFSMKDEFATLDGGCTNGGCGSNAGCSNAGCR